MADRGTQVDLRGLAIDRGDGGSGIRVRRHLLTRYALPTGLVAGFLALVAWSVRDYLFPPRPVTVVPVLSTQAEVRQAGTPLFKAAGWIEPRPTPIGVPALAAGVVERLLVVENQQVRQGEPVAELVRDDAQLACDAAEADLRLRQAELQEAIADRDAARTRLEQPVHLQAVLGEAEAGLAKIETQLEELPFKLRQAGAERDAAQAAYDGKRAARDVVAGVDLSRAKSELDAAVARVEGLRRQQETLERERTALRQRRDALQTQLELLADETREVAAAEARVRAAEARVELAGVARDQARLRLQRMTVRAPVDGRIYSVIGHPGSHVGGGERQLHGHDGSTVVTMYRPEMLQARVDVRFEDIPKVALGQAAEIDNPALPSPLVGRVLFVSSEADIQKNTLEVKVEIPDPPAVFKPEMLVDVTFLSPEPADDLADAEQRVERIFVPQRLVREEGGNAYVWLADRSARVARRQPIQLGTQAGNGLVEVTGGLNLSSRIIAGGAEALSDGCRIRITGEESPPGDGEAGSSVIGEVAEQQP